MRARSSPQAILLLLLLFVRNINVIDAFITSPQRQGPLVIADRSRRLPASTIIPLEMKKKDDPNTETERNKEMERNKKTERSKQIVSSVIFPLIALFGLDLLLNIAVITKKVVLTYVTGQDQVEVSPPWW
jgi:hypothetical protein